MRWAGAGDAGGSGGDGTDGSDELILLKPTNDIGSQVIVNGEVIGNMSARDYFAYKKKLVPDILAAYHRLEEQADIIDRRRGKPGGDQLKENDIVNMGLAELLNAPVLIAGDIDRGGVLLLGTSSSGGGGAQAGKGFIINKFGEMRPFLRRESGCWKSAAAFRSSGGAVHADFPRG